MAPSDAPEHEQPAHGAERAIPSGRLAAAAGRAVVTMDANSAKRMTVKEIAAALGVNRDTARTRIRHGYLPATRGRPADDPGPPRLRVSRADVRAFAEAHCTGTPRPGWLDEDA